MNFFFTFRTLYGQRRYIFEQKSAKTQEKSNYSFCFRWNPGWAVSVGFYFILIQQFQNFPGKIRRIVIKRKKSFTIKKIYHLNIGALRIK